MRGSGLIPFGAVEVTFSKLLRRYDIHVAFGRVFAGSVDAVNLAIYRMNKMTRRWRRGDRNPTRETKRTDFGARL